MPALSSASRRLATTLLALGLGVTALTACSPGGDRSAEGCVPSGAASDAIDVSGEFGEAPKIEFASPLDTESTQRTVIVEGDDSDAADTGDTVTVAYTMLNGGSGEELVASGYTEDSRKLSFPIDESMFQPGLDLAVMQTLNCAVVGDRVVAAISAEDAFGGAGNEQMGLGATDPVVFVFDVLSVDAPVDAAADLVTVEPGSEGMPTVEYSPEGVPTVSFPESDPLEELTLAVITEGDGEPVGSGDIVEVHYTGINWNSGEVFDSSWERGAPETFPTDGVIPGFSAALVDQPVGSQVLVVIPPAYGYGAGGSAGGIGGEDTIVFIVDILGATAQ